LDYFIFPLLIANFCRAYLRYM